MSNAVDFEALAAVAVFDLPAIIWIYLSQHIFL
jgi:hypothetical protein